MQQFFLCKPGPAGFSMVFLLVGEGSRSPLGPQPSLSTLPLFYEGEKLKPASLSALGIAGEVWRTGTTHRAPPTQEPFSSHSATAHLLGLNGHPSRGLSTLLVCEVKAGMLVFSGCCDIELADTRGTAPPGASPFLDKAPFQPSDPQPTVPGPGRC